MNTDDVFTREALKQKDEMITQLTEKIVAQATEIERLLATCKTWKELYEAKNDTGPA